MTTVLAREYKAHLHSTRITVKGNAKTADRTIFYCPRHAGTVVVVVGS